MKNKIIAAIYFFAVYIPVLLVVGQEAFSLSLPLWLSDLNTIIAGFGLICLTPLVIIRLIKA